MSKRFLATLLASVMAVGACMPASAEAEKEKLIMMIWGTTSSQEKLRDLIFEKNPELAEKMELEFIVAGANDLDVAEKYRLSLASNSYIADIIMLNSLEVGEFAQDQTFVDCGDLIEANRDGLLESAIECCYYDDYCAGISQNLKHGLWYYNKTMFDEAGIDPNQIEDADQLIEAGLKLREMFPDSYLFHVGPNKWNEHIGDAWANAGARYFDEDGNYIFNQEPAIRSVLEDFKRIYDAGIVGPIDSWTPEWNAGFANRQIASAISQSWFSTFGATLVTEGTDEWSVALEPRFGTATERTGMTQAGAQMLCIPTSAKNIDLAKEYISSWITYDGGCAITEELGQTPLRSDVFEKFEDVEHEAWGKEFYRVSRESSETAGRPALLGPKTAAEMPIIKGYINQYMNGELDIDTMLDQCNNDLEMQIGNALY